MTARRCARSPGGAATASPRSSPSPSAGTTASRRASGAATSPDPDLGVLPLAVVAPRLERQPADDDDDRREVEQRLPPVAEVGDDRRSRHCVFAAESSHRPRLVNVTMTASIQYCDRVASRAERYIEIARSCARIRPHTWPPTSAATCTYQMPVALMTL